MQALLDVLNDEKDFAIVIIATGYLDACLGSLLRSSLLRSGVTDQLLDPGRGALGSLTVRADLAYSMSLIPKAMYQDLIQLAQVRNMFAHHHIALSFADLDIQKACSSLNYMSTLKNGDLDELLFHAGRPLPPPKERFKFTALFILDFLLRAAETNVRLQTAGAEEPDGLRVQAAVPTAKASDLAGMVTAPSRGKQRKQPNFDPASLTAKTRR
ncbi:MltR family transcriptional regulator [Roseateles sp. P5_E1]